MKRDTGGLDDVYDDVMTSTFAHLTVNFRQGYRNQRRFAAPKYFAARRERGWLVVLEQDGTEHWIPTDDVETVRVKR